MSHRTSVAIPDEEYNPIKEIADRSQRSVVDLIRTAFRIFILIYNAIGDGKSEFIIRNKETKTEKEIIFIL